MKYVRYYHRWRWTAELRALWLLWGPGFTVRVDRDVDRDGYVVCGAKWSAP